MKVLLLVLLAIATSVIALNIKYKPLSYFNLDCNTCQCTPAGEVGWCTKIACATNEGIVTQLKSAKVARYVTEEMCEPGSSFRKYCNWCKCSVSSKMAACTLMACDKNVGNPNGTMKISTPEVPEMVANKV